MVKISPRNSKLGKIANVSLPPVITCPNSSVREYPIAWLSTDIRQETRQRTVYKCEGKCDTCLECFDKSVDVVFEIH